MNKRSKLLLSFSIIVLTLFCLNFVFAASASEFDSLKKTMKYSLYIVLGIMVIIVTAFIILFRNRIIDVYSQPRDLLLKGIASVYLVNPNYINDPKVVANLERAGISKDEVIKYAIIHEAELTNKSSSIPKDEKEESSEEPEEEAPKTIEDVIYNKIESTKRKIEAKAAQQTPPMNSQMPQEPPAPIDTISEKDMDSILAPQEDTNTKSKNSSQNDDNDL